MQKHPDVSWIQKQRSSTPSYEPSLWLMKVITALQAVTTCTGHKLESHLQAIACTKVWPSVNHSRSVQHWQRRGSALTETCTTMSNTSVVLFRKHKLVHHEHSFCALLSKKKNTFMVHFLIHEIYLLKSKWLQSSSAVYLMHLFVLCNWTLSGLISNKFSNPRAFTLLYTGRWSNHVHLIWYAKRDSSRIPQCQNWYSKIKRSHKM